MKKPKAFPRGDVRSRHLSFITANFEQLAAAAYAGFLEDGRGMILLADEDFIKKPLGVFVKFRQCYMAKGSKIFAAAGNKLPGDKEEGWVAEYDPKRTLLVAFSRSGGISSYRILGVGAGICQIPGAPNESRSAWHASPLACQQEHQCSSSIFYRA